MIGKVHSTATKGAAVLKLDVQGKKTPNESQNIVPSSSPRDMVSRKKGSVEIMEYMFMTLFIVAIILGIVIFLSWWQISQAESQKNQLQMDRLLSLSKGMLGMGFLANEDSLLDDAKLTAAQSMPGFCQEAGDVFGTGWFAVVRLLDGRNDTACTVKNYPECNRWEFCKDPSKKTYRSYVLPVNIYRNIAKVMTTGILGGSRVGMIEVGVYT